VGPFASKRRNAKEPTTPLRARAGGVLLPRMARVPDPRRFRSLLLILVGSLGVSATALAQQEEAEKLIRQGVELRRQGQNLEALPFFQRAYAVFPSSRAGAQLGFVEQSVGLSLEAEKHVSAALADEGDPWVRKNKTAIVQALADIRAGLGRLLIEAGPPGAVVAINGSTVTAKELENPIYVKPGSTYVEVRRDGFDSQSKTVTVLAGTTQRLAILLRPSSSRDPSAAPAAPPTSALDQWSTPARARTFDTGADSQGKRLAGIALLSVAAVAVVGGTTCLLIANEKIDSIEKDAQAMARYNESNGSFPSFQRLSQGLYVTAAASAVAGAWLLFFSRSSSSASGTGSRLTTALVGDGAPGMALHGQF
jgi:hypothetical protein